MTSRIDAAVVWSRALLLGVVTLFLGVAGHVTADGLLPGPLALGALFGATVLLSAPMLARQVSAVRMVALLVGGQTVIHLVLSLAAGHRGDATAATASPGTALGALPIVDGRRVGSLQDAYDGAAGHGGGLAPAVPVGHLVDDLAAHAPMMAAHLAAAALVGLWLAYGERCLFTLLALTGRRVLAAASALTPVAVLPRVARFDTDRTLAGPRSVWLVRPDSRRGPPLLAA